MTSQIDAPPLPPLDRDDLLDRACARAGQDDFGDLWFLEPMQHFIDAANAESRSTVAGRASQAETTINGLVNRLRMVEDIKRHPEILDEDVRVAGIILGLPRTGSTLFQRLLASVPGMTAMRWFEGQNYARFPGEARGEPAERIELAQGIIDDWLKLAPDLLSIHPLEPGAPDEEVMIMGQMFVSTMVEGMNHVPSFARWLNGYDQSRGYEDFKTILKYLQWQDPARRGSGWILKSPSHLPYTDVVARAFPDALLIMTHRDPVQTVPSYISLQASLYQLNASIGDKEVAAFWFPRLVEWMTRFQAARERIGEDRFIDIDYRAVVKRPMVEAERVLARFGISADARVETALVEFLAGNKREQRPVHDYSAERFGLTDETISQAFAAYRARFIG